MVRQRSHGYFLLISTPLTNEISRVFLEGSTAAAAGGSALTLTGLFEAY